jgi:hypothetical protein
MSLLDQGDNPLLDESGLPLDGTAGATGEAVVPVVVGDPVDWSPLEEQLHTWRITIVTAGEAWHLPQYSGIDLTLTHDGTRATVEIPSDLMQIGYIRDLVTDLIYYRDDVQLFRLRVVDSEDIIGRDGAVTRFECVSYEYLLKRRILRQDRVITDEDIDAAWGLIAYTQAFETLNIVRGTLTPGVTRQRTFDAGTTIADAINDFAQADGGFDWWIDSNLVFHAAKPRRGVALDDDWLVGSEVAAIQRVSPVEDYASVILATGATGETRIPDGSGGETVYPPPPAQLVEAPTKPFGLWETAVSYGDVVTAASLLTKANWHLLDKGNIRPTYSLTLESGIWHPGIGLGDVITLRVVVPPRIDIKVPIRIEEIKVSCSPDGNETVSMSVRAEEPETFLTPSPIGPIPEIALAAPNGKTVQTRRLSGVDDLAHALRTLNDRLKVQEYSGSGSAPAPWVTYTTTMVAEGGGDIGQVLLIARYRRTGSTVDFKINMNCLPGWGGGIGRYRFSLPFAAINEPGGLFEQDGVIVKVWCALGNLMGVGHIPAGSSWVYPMAPSDASSNILDFVRNTSNGAAGTGVPAVVLGGTGYFTFESPGRNMVIEGSYIAAV